MRQVHPADSATAKRTNAPHPKLRGRLSEERLRRWADVKSGYLRAQALGVVKAEPG